MVARVGDEKVVAQDGEAGGTQEGAGSAVAAEDPERRQVG